MAQYSDPDLIAARRAEFKAYGAGLPMQMAFFAECLGSMVFNQPPETCERVIREVCAVIITTKQGVAADRFGLHWQEAPGLDGTDTRREELAQLLACAMLGPNEQPTERDRQNIQQIRARLADMGQARQYKH